MDNKPLDVPGEVAKATTKALREVGKAVDTSVFVEEFLHAAGDNMARPVRLEDVEHFAELAADQVLSDRVLREDLIALIKSGLFAYMRPA